MFKSILLRVMNSLFRFIIVIRYLKSKVYVTCCILLHLFQEKHVSLLSFSQESDLWSFRENPLRASLRHICKMFICRFVCLIRIQISQSYLSRFLMFYKLPYNGETIFICIPVGNCHAFHVDTKERIESSIYRRKLISHNFLSFLGRLKKNVLIRAMKYAQMLR